MQIETLYSNQTFVFGVYIPRACSIFLLAQVVRGKPQRSKQEVVDHKGSLEKCIHILTKLCGNSELIYVCASFFLSFSCLSYSSINRCHLFQKKQKLVSFGGRFGCVPKNVIRAEDVKDMCNS